MERPSSPSPKTGPTNKILAVAGGGLLAMALVYFYTHNPEQGGAFLPCPLRVTTGLSCPGCGSQRAIHYLLHGEFLRAWRYNELLPVYVLYGSLLLTFGLWDGLPQKFPRVYRWLRSKPVVLGFLALMAVHFIWRNFLR